MRHRGLPLLPVLLLAGLAACGGDGPPVATGGRERAGDPGNPSSDVVVEVRYEGGLLPEAAFLVVPQVLVTGDGRLIAGGPVPAVYPGPLLPNLQETHIGSAGVDRLLDRARADGLLADVTYSRPHNVADGADVVVTVRAGGRTYEHRAYALGYAGGPDGREADPARARLQDFVGALSAAGKEASAGNASPYVSDSYLVQATSVDPRAGSGAAGGIEPKVVDWPAGAPVRLAAAAHCALVPAAAVHDLLASANQLTRFADGGVVYSLAVLPRLPGHACA